MNRVLVVAPHYDDEIISTFGFLKRYYTDVIHICSGNGPADPREPLTEEFVSELGCTLLPRQTGYPDLSVQITDIPVISQLIETILWAGNYDTLVIPSENDPHQDHSIIGRACVQVFRHGIPYFVQEVLAFKSSQCNLLRTEEHFDSVIKLVPEESEQKEEMVHRFGVETNIDFENEYYKTLYRIIKP